MKKLTKVLPLLLALVMLFSFSALATEESTTIPEESTTVPEESTTVPDESTTEPETTEPETTEPEITEPEIVLPGVTSSLTAKAEGDMNYSLTWEAVEGATGYNVYRKSSGKWVLLGQTDQCTYALGQLLRECSYRYAVKAYTEIDGEQHFAQDYAELPLKTPSIPTTTLKATSAKSGVKLTWKEIDGVTGYRIYIRKSGKWVKIKDVEGATSYTYTKADIGKSYRFSVKAYVKGTKDYKWGGRDSCSITFKDVMQTEITSAKKTASTVTLKWKAVDGAKGYRVYVYKNKEWKALKTLKDRTYKVTGLEASTKYKFRVKAYSKKSGKTVWHTASETYSVTTSSKTVKAYRVKNLQKYFSDGDWYIKIKGMKDSNGDKFNYVIAGKGQNLFARYDYSKSNTVEYLYLDSKETVYGILDSDKVYCVLPEEEAYNMLSSMYTVSEILKVQNVGKVTAKTTVFNGKTAVAETYKDTVYGFTKTYYFVKDKVAGVKIKYSDGTTEQYSSFSVTDTPSSSLFSIPSGYKKISYY